MRCTKMKIYEIRYTGFSAKNINDTLINIQLRTLLFNYDAHIQYITFTKSKVVGSGVGKNMKIFRGRGYRNRDVGNSIAGNSSKLISMYTVIKRQNLLYYRSSLSNVRYLKKYHTKFQTIS